MPGQLKYEDPAPITEEELDQEMESGDPGRQYEALIRASLHIPKSEMLVFYLVEHIAENAYPVVEAALTACSHVARLVGLDRPHFWIDLISYLLRDPQVGEHAQIIIGDIEIFCLR